MLVFMVRAHRFTRQSRSISFRMGAAWTRLACEFAGGRDERAVIGARWAHATARLLREGERVVKHYRAPEALEEACAIPVAVRASHMHIDVTVRAAKRTIERRLRRLSHGRRSIACNNIRAIHLAPLPQDVVVTSRGPRCADRSPAGSPRP